MTKIVCKGNSQNPTFGTAYTLYSEYNPLFSGADSFLTNATKELVSLVDSPNFKQQAVIQRSAFNLYTLRIDCRSPQEITQINCAGKIEITTPEGVIHYAELTEPLERLEFLENVHLFVVQLTYRDVNLANYADGKQPVYDYLKSEILARAATEPDAAFTLAELVKLNYKKINILNLTVSDAYYVDEFEAYDLLFIGETAATVGQTAYLQFENPLFQYIDTGTFEIVTPTSFKIRSKKCAESITPTLDTGATVQIVYFTDGQIYSRVLPLPFVSKNFNEVVETETPRKFVFQRNNLQGFSYLFYVSDSEAETLQNSLPYNRAEDFNIKINGVFYNSLEACEFEFEPAETLIDCNKLRININTVQIVIPMQ